MLDPQKVNSLAPQTRAVDPETKFQVRLCLQLYLPKCRVFSNRIYHGLQFIACSFTSSKGLALLINL